MEGKDLAGISKILRKQNTPWENKLWYHLRGKRFYGLKFKRQVPMGDYVVDFCCQGKKLAVELDGGGHNEVEISQRDKLKQKFLENNGYIVLRFWNNQIDENIEGVLQRIKEIMLRN